MDPITVTAIVAALSAGVVTGADKVVETALVDAYHELKNTLRRKFGDDSEVVKAVDTVEEDPKAEAPRGRRRKIGSTPGPIKTPRCETLPRHYWIASNQRPVASSTSSTFAEALWPKQTAAAPLLSIYPPRDYEPLPSGEPPVVRPPGWTSRTGLHRRGWEQLHTKILNSGGHTPAIGHQRRHRGRERNGEKQFQRRAISECATARVW